MRVITRLAVPTVAVLMLCGCSGDNSNHQSEVVSACHDALSDQFSNPATADWQSTLTTDVKRYPNGYDVSGTVSAENDFGVKTDYYFRCTEDKQFNILRSGISPQ
jgi:hypothetical protein